MKILIISLFILIATPLFAQAEKEIGSFDILDGIVAVSHTRTYNSYIRPVVFNSPTNSLAWGLGFRQKI
ncbi:MAG: hypothetical protein WCQ53_02515 [bacterium]